MEHPYSYRVSKPTSAQPFHRPPNLFASICLTGSMSSSTLPFWLCYISISVRPNISSKFVSPESPPQDARKKPTAAIFNTALIVEDPEQFTGDGVTGESVMQAGSANILLTIMTTWRSPSWANQGFIQAPCIRVPGQLEDEARTHLHPLVPPTSKLWWPNENVPSHPILATAWSQCWSHSGELYLTSVSCHSTVGGSGSQLRHDWCQQVPLDCYIDLDLFSTLPSTTGT